MLAHREMIKTISEPGAFPGFAGDIVDQGILRGNQQPPQFSADGKTATFRNTAEYALIVYLGATFRAGRSWSVKSYQRKTKNGSVTVEAHTRTRRKERELKGRPWMELALKRMDFERTMMMLLRAKC